MHITVASYIETLLCPDGRFRLLQGIVPVCDSVNRPIFSCTRDYVLFDVVFDNRPFIMGCSLSGRFERPYTDRSLNLKHDRNRYISGWEVYSKEALVFDSSLNPVRTDIVLQPKPEGYYLADWMRMMLFSDDRTPWRLLLKNIAGVCRSLTEDKICHGAIKPENIIVGGNFSLTVMNYPLIGLQSIRNDDAGRFGAIALACYVAASDPETVYEAGMNRLLNPLYLKSIFKEITLQAEFSKNKALNNLAKSLFSGKPAGNDIWKLIQRLTLSDFEPMPLLRELLDIDAANKAPEFAGDSGRAKKKVAEKRESGVRAKADFSRCQYVGEIKDTLILICENGLWGYTDRNGYYVIDPCFEEACDFYEGRAAVLAESGWGLIDREGRFIMDPHFDTLEWYGRCGVCGASHDGIWELYDRSGNAVTSGRFDWIGECSEGVFVVSRNGKYGYVRSDGQYLTDLRFDEAFPFQDGAGHALIDGKPVKVGKDPAGTP